MITLEAYIAEATRLFTVQDEVEVRLPLLPLQHRGYKEIEALSRKVSDASHEMKAIAHIVTEMQNIRREMEGY